ncbi:hypothetical protein LTR85_001615 [Meristemomyces frigidus]|nr:hypothetical protein LTR85_001615 [Meristemomyces frigidus]
MSVFEDAPPAAPAITLIHESSLNLPTLTVSFFTPPPEATTTNFASHPTTTTSILPITEGCTECDGIIPGIMPTVPSHATTTAAAMALPSQTMVSGIITPAATSADAIWYRQPWTVPAAGLLCVYSLCSAITLAMMLFTGRLDTKLNVRRTQSRHRFGESEANIRQWIFRSPARRARQELYDLWRIDSVDDRAVQREHNHNLNARRDHVRASHASVAETEINYDDEQQPTDQMDWYRAMEMQPYQGAYVWAGEREIHEAADHDAYEATGARVMPEDNVRRMIGHGVYAEADVLAQGGAEAVARFRHILGDERYEEQLRAWRLHELQRMQTRMVQAGYF